MQPLYHLPIRFFELLDDLGLRCRSVRRRADIVDPFKDDRVLDPGLGEDVPIDSGQGVRAQSVGEDPVSTSPLVEYGEREIGLLKTGRKVVGPPVVGSRVELLETCLKADCLKALCSYRLFSLVSLPRPSVMLSPTTTMAAASSRSATTSIPLI